MSSTATYTNSTPLGDDDSILGPDPRAPSIDVTFATPDYTPDLSRVPTAEQDDTLAVLKTTLSKGNMGEAYENLANARTSSTYVHPEEDLYELRPSASVRGRRKSSLHPIERRLSSIKGLAEELGSPAIPIKHGAPPEVGSLTKEIIFVLVCSSGQLLFASLQGNVNVNQETFKSTLGLQSSQLPWLNGSFLVALGLSVIIAGSVTDLAPPRLVIVAAFAWLMLWNIVGCFCLTPERAILYFLSRAFQGLAIGVLVSGSMSILGRVYKPGLRKTRVFSAMAAMAPFGFWIGALQGGAFSSNLVWIFGTNTIISFLLCVAAYFTIPALTPIADIAGSDVPSLRSFDWQGATCIGVSFICLLYGLTQGSVANWAVYTYILVIVGVLALGLFFWIESRVARPLIPNRLWKTKGFAPLMGAYFLGFGSFVGAWQFYAMQFFLRIQGKSAIIVALYLLPNAIMGVLATFIVSRLLHIVPGHWIYIASMLAFALGPAFFLPQTPHTTYWALSMPGIALATFGPDLSFAAASIFITSNVARSYQGSAGSLLVTIQNLSSAIMTAVSDAIGSQVDKQENGDIGLKGLKAIWWFALGASLLGALITAAAVRIPKEEEKEHVT
jgi:MFS family permease